MMASFKWGSAGRFLQEHLRRKRMKSTLLFIICGSLVLSCHDTELESQHKVLASEKTSLEQKLSSAHSQIGQLQSTNAASQTRIEELSMKVEDVESAQAALQAKLDKQKQESERLVRELGEMKKTPANTYREAVLLAQKAKERPSRGHFEDAINALDSFVTNFPVHENSKQATSLRGELAVEWEKMAEAEYATGEKFFQQGDFASAQSRFEKATAIMPGYKDADSMANKSSFESTRPPVLFELELVALKKSFPHNSGKEGGVEVHLELRSKYNKHVDDFCIQASLRDRSGKYLAGKSLERWENPRPGSTDVGDMAWNDVDIAELGSMILTPCRNRPYRIEGKDDRFPLESIRIVPDQFGIPMSF
jgi:tetratricopeptide (TPR) repeat protein